jgi:hypothetical protein
LYELLLGAAPAHNWLPDGDVPIRVWERDGHWSWLELWRTWFVAISRLPVTMHRFDSTDRLQQTVQYGDDVRAQFDFATGRFLLDGVEGISSHWTDPPVL